MPSLALVDGQFDLTMLGFFLDSDLHQFSGKAETHLEITGRTSLPKLSGFFAIHNGSYDNAITRSGVHKIECRLNAGQIKNSLINLQSIRQQPLSFRVENCTAKDSDSGSLALNGSILLPLDTEVGLIDLEMKVKKMNIIQRADIESQLTGEVTLKGDFNDVWARGELDISPLTATIDGNFGGNIPSIEVIDIEELKNAKTEDEIKGNGLFSMPAVHLDLKIVADQKAYVRGRGLEAELYGEMGIKGILSNPELTGEFNVRRGHFDVFNKRFDLEKGKVSFANEAIALDIEGAYKKSGEEIRAKLIGPSDQVEVKLSSIPKKPDDEILALLIFGKSVSSITPFEAVRLAMAVQTLRGGHSAFDPIDSTRELLGVDTITIDSQDDNGNEGVNLGVGKYLNERVYLELQRTPDPSQPWKGNLEIELTPKVNLESSAGGSTGIEGSEITWKHDY